MLVLSRKREETVVFPGLGIQVQILQCSSSKVRIGIQAPNEVAILRGEVADRAAMEAFKDAKSASPKRAIEEIKQSPFHHAADLLNKLESKTGSEKQAKQVLDQLDALDTEMRNPAKPRHALLVDDNDNESKLLSSYLRIKGIEVETASNGMEAIKRIDEHQPGIVLLDMAMPEFDGRWTIDQIRSNQALADLTVYAVSGTPHTDSNVEVGPGGVNGWFCKPLNPESLVDEISKTVGPHLVA